MLHYILLPFDILFGILFIIIIILNKPKIVNIYNVNVKKNY